MKVSVIIPTYNEEKVIGQCLESLSKQNYSDMEIIVVDDGSTDRTLESIKSITPLRRGYAGQAGIKSLKILKQSHKGPGAARNLGAKQAMGEILVFVDSDMIFAQDFIEHLIEPIVKEKVRGTFSKNEYVANPENIWSICWGINEGWVPDMRHPANYPNTQKVFRAILKSEFEKVGGFSLTGYTDDWTLSEKLGYLAENTNAIFYHKNPDTLNDVFKQAKWIGKRKYKLGNVGTLVALARSSLPVSLVVGLWKSLVNLIPAFIIFKIVYDFGIFAGALQSLVGGNSAK